MKFGERQTHAGETDEWSRRGIKAGMGGRKLPEEGKARGSWWKAEREEATPHGERRRVALKG